MQNSESNFTLHQPSSVRAPIIQDSESEVEKRSNVTSNLDSVYSFIGYDQPRARDPAKGEKVNIDLLQAQMNADQIGSEQLKRVLRPNQRGFVIRRRPPKNFSFVKKKPGSSVKVGTRDLLATINLKYASEDSVLSHTDTDD